MRRHMGPLSCISLCTGGAPGLSAVIMFLGLIRILINIAHTAGFQNGPRHVDHELLRTDSEQDWRQHCGMLKKKRNSKESARATIASVKKEMEQPRLTESVRNDRRYQPTLTADKVGRVGNSPSRRKVSDER
jgi:hypothetical protein